MSNTRGERTLVLSMIVKNEARVIDRCLDAALPLVNAYVIVDTGSTDATKEKIKEVAARHNVLGLISDDEWKNFGHNRTRAAALTRQYANERGFDLPSTYMLLLDADMLLVDTGFSRDELTMPGYLIEQRSVVGIDDKTAFFGDPDWLKRLVGLPVSLQWSNTRLCRLDHLWEAVSVTHEYWRAIPDAPLGRLDSLWIADIGDGGAKGDKQSRDVRLLEQGIRDEPNNPRYYFYLAQTFFDMGRNDEAIPLYRKRIEIGGWEEECWYSLYRIGLAQFRSGKEAEGIATLIEAYDRRSTRAEPLAALSKYLREKRTSATALLLAERALSMPPSTDSLFVHTDAYSIDPLEDVSILAYYHGDHPRGLLACEEILSTKGLSSNRYEQAARNALFYRKPALLALRRGKFEVPAERRTFDGVEYLASSAALVRAKDGVLANIRLVNYDHHSGRSFIGRDADRRIRTENLLYDLDLETMQISSPRLGAPSTPADWKLDTYVLGLEDERWACHDGRLYFTTVVYQIPGHENRPQMALGVAEPSGTATVRPLEYARSQPIEKSWLPFSHDGELLLIYSYEPFLVLKVDVDETDGILHTAKCTEHCRYPLAVRSAKWRGNAPPVTLPDGRMLMLVHELAYRDADNVYLHRFVELDPKSLRPIHYSEAFSFDHQGVEYALGLITHGEHLIASFGYEERESHWIELDPAVIAWLPFQP
jgi:glycosyltransferase involved in cell wall biosynthesis